MTTIIHRNAFFLKNVPPNVAYYRRDYSGSELKVVTWDDVLNARRERQRRILDRKLSHSEIRAVRIHVRYFDIFPYGGWHTYIDGIRFSMWLRNHDWLKQQLTTLFPLQFPRLFPSRYGAWDDWQEGFAREHQRGTFHGRPRGVAYAWARVSGDHIEEILSEVKKKG